MRCNKALILIAKLLFKGFCVSYKVIDDAELQAAQTFFSYARLNKFFHNVRFRQSMTLFVEANLCIELIQIVNCMDDLCI